MVKRKSVSLYFFHTTYSDVGQVTATGNSYHIHMRFYHAVLAPTTVLGCSPYLEPSCSPKWLLWECSPRVGRSVATKTAQRT